MTTILLVEDNELNRDMLSRRLSRKGFDVQFAFDGQEAVEKAKALMPDLVLMDINMPCMDGNEALQQIRATPTIDKLPVVMLTTSDSPRDIDTSYSAGANAYITKPVDEKGFIDAVQKLDRFWFQLVTLPAQTSSTT